MKVGDTLAAIDYYADCIPGLSTVTNLVDLFEKCVVLPFMEKTTVKGNHYFSHVSYKSAVNSLALLIPGLNVVVFICRSINWKSNKNYMMWKVRENGLFLQEASESLKNDKDVVLAAVKCDGLALQHASKQLQSDEEIVRVALDKNGLALEFADETLRAKQELVLLAIEKDGHAIEHASEDLKKSEKVGLEVVSSLGHQALRYFDESLKDNIKVMVQVMKKEAEDGNRNRATPFKLTSFQKASERLKKDYRFVSCAVHWDGMILGLVSEELKNNLILVRLASGQNPEAFQFASEKGIRGDKDRIKEFLKKNGLNLKYATEEIQDDIASVRIAFAQNRDALRFASERVRKILVKKDNSTEGDE